MGFEATARAEHHDRLIAEATAIRPGLAQFDRVATAAGGTLPEAVLAVLRDPRNGIDFARNIGTGEWPAKLADLLAPPED